MTKTNTRLYKDKRKRQKRQSPTTRLARPSSIRQGPQTQGYPKRQRQTQTQGYPKRQKQRRRH